MSERNPLSRLVIAARVASVRLSIWLEERVWRNRRRGEPRPDDRPMLIHPEDIDLAEEMVGPLGPVVMATAPGDPDPRSHYRVGSVAELYGILMRDYPGARVLRQTLGNVGGKTDVMTLELPDLSKVRVVFAYD